MKSLKRDRAPSLPVLKTAAEDIFVGDNIAVRRQIFGNGNVQKSEEICIATVIEVKTVQSKGVAQSLRNLNVELQQDREREDQEKQQRSLSTERNTDEYSEGHKRLRSEEPFQIQLHDDPENTSTSLPEIKAGPLSEDKSRESSCDDTSTKQIYYVHYNGMDRRLDEWIDKSRIVEEEGEYITTLTPADKSKTLTRSQRRFQEEFHHLQKSYDDMDATTAKLEREHEERTKVKNVELIQFGEYEIDAWYFSPFPLPVTINNSKVFFCEYCLWYTVDQEKYICHVVHSCKERKPPGEEVYYHEKLAVYEVSGHECKTYCQSLCLLSKLFLDHKTLYYDVESFMFYVLCEIDENGAHLVGHFSKELNSANNLACIMVLPPFQRNGYGKLLIQMSYCLSEREGVIGTPERPLSDLGKVSYRSYWWWVLLAVLNAIQEERRVDENISVGDLSRLSGIHVDDIIYTFNTLQLVRYWKGDHVVRASRKIVYHCKRLQLFHPPKLILNTAAVKWQPKTII